MEPRLPYAQSSSTVGRRAHTTVAAMAHRWGFTHLGRFAAAHKMKFGNTPAQALHAAR